MKQNDRRCGRKMYPGRAGRPCSLLALAGTAMLVRAALLHWQG